MNITVEPYNTNWPSVFEIEAVSIKEALNDVLVSIYHIGSTSVPGSDAKPIIDILLVVNSLEALDLENSKFEELGYEVCGKFGISNRRYYRKGGDDRTHQIHAFHVSNITEIERHLIFRDYLRKHTDACTSYANLKRELAHLYPNDIDKYSDGKDSLVKSIERDSLI